MLRIFLIILIALQRYETKELECAIANEAKTRFFDSVVHFQANKIPFSPQQPGWQGSNIEFTFSRIEKLEKNTFISETSQAIILLKLSGKHIKKIDEGAFISLVCLRELYLDNNNITKLTRNVFTDLGRLQTLDLSNNKIENLEDQVFSNLGRLKILNLANNRIKRIQVLAFTNLTKLEYLNLEHNDIEILEPELFRPVVSLNNLSLAWNMIRDVDFEKWKGLKNLRFLDLAGNNLDHFDPTYNFSFSGLVSLNLSSNSLSQLNVMAVKRHLSLLQLIDLNDNQWFCDDLGRIVHELMDSGIKFVARNYTTTVNVYGIACIKFTSFSTRPMIENVVSTTRKTAIHKDEMERYVEKKIGDSNAEVRSEISDLRSFIIFVFALVCLFILFEILVRTDCCRFFLNKFKGGNEMYVDNNDVENFRLLGR